MTPDIVVNVSCHVDSCWQSLIKKNSVLVHVMVFDPLAQRLSVMMAELGHFFRREISFLC